MEQQKALERIEAATDYYALFGAENGAAEYVKRLYRRLARLVYEDLFQDQEEKTRARAAFQRLNEFYKQALRAIERGCYGQPVDLAVFKNARWAHAISHALGSGDLCSLYAAGSTPNRGGDERPTFCKVAKTPGDNDLLITEAKVLRCLRNADVDDRLHPFFPELIDTFAYRSAGKPSRQVNILASLEGFYNLAQIKQAFPQGVSPLHVTWIWRRILYALGHAHQQKIVHGALLPGHVMVLPAQHGVVLIDWCYASMATDSGITPAVTAIVNAYRDWYPKEVFAKQSPSPATDIVMAARCMIELLGGDPLAGNHPANTTVPQAFRAFFRGCLQTSQRARPQNALQLLVEFDQLLERLGQPYYPRKFRVFTMPTGVV